MALGQHMSVSASAGKSTKGTNWMHKMFQGALLGFSGTGTNLVVEVAWNVIVKGDKALFISRWFCFLFAFVGCGVTLWP
jgi:hypothetical protein